MSFLPTPGTVPFVVFVIASSAVLLIVVGELADWFKRRKGNHDGQG